MANILVAGNRKHPSPDSEKIANSLRQAGFAVQHGWFDELESVLGTLAQFDGHLHGIVLVEENLKKDEVLPLAVAEASAVRRLSDAVSFQGAIKANALPIAAIVHNTSTGNWDRVAWSFASTKEDALQSTEKWLSRFKTLLTDWRQELVEELDYAGFAITKDEIGQIRVSPTLVRYRRESKMLTDEATPGGLKRGQYLILADDLAQHVQTFDEFQYLLQSYKDVACQEGIKPETVFQRFFESNPHYILRDQFDQSFPKPILRVPGENEHLSPDFVQQPRVMSAVGTKWEVLDLKLPDDPLVVNRTFHAKISARLHAAIEQLTDYREFFSRPEAAQELIRLFGVRPVNPRLAVIMGKRSPDEVEALDGALGRFLDVEVITYDEILDLEARRLSALRGLAILRTP